MDASEAILERWVARTAESYPRYATALLSEERDPFRNPMGDALRRNLSQLLHELFGEMDATAIDSALDPIIRLQVVQGFAPDDAVRFVSLLKDLLREDGPEQNSEALGGSLDSRRIDNARIDRLADIAADKYAQCREQLTRIRANEVRRANQVQQRIRARRPA
ncbi:MAG: RsbRD N-terminal domain-containing protein [Terriglobales bacterium]|jgi:hypothetical protein